VLREYCSQYNNSHREELRASFKQYYKEHIVNKERQLISNTTSVVEELLHVNVLGRFQTEHIGTVLSISNTFVLTGRWRYDLTKPKSTDKYRYLKAVSNNLSNAKVLKQ